MARLLTTTAAAVAAVAALAACGEDGRSDGQADSRRPISFQLFGDPEEVAVYRDLVAAYERAGGGEVRIVPVGDRGDHLAKLTASFVARRPPDVFLVNYRNLGTFASRGAVEPVQSLVERPGGLEVEELYPVTAAGFTIKGRLQCVPQNASSLVVYFNRHAFRSAGVALPRAGWRYATPSLRGFRTRPREASHARAARSSMTRG